MSIKSKLREINRREGWRDGQNRETKNIPTQLVSKRIKGGFIHINSPVPFDEEQAYHDGYEEGLNSSADAVNPYL